MILPGFPSQIEKRIREEFLMKRDEYLIFII